MERRPGKALSRHLIMRVCKKVHKWKEAGTFVPARMKKKNIYFRKTYFFLWSILYIAIVKCM